MSGAPNSAAALADDRAGRRAAVLEFARPVYLRAGAGTGKTTTLVARILAWTTGPGWEAARHEDPARDEAQLAQATLSGLVAMTFTEAAAADMDRKVRAELKQLSEGLPVRGLEPGDLAPEAARRARRLLSALQAPLCTTIHAWCRGLLLRRHAAAGLDPRFEVDGEGEALRATLHEAVRADLQEQAARGGGEWTILGARGAWPDEVARAAARLHEEGVRAVDLAEDPWSDEAQREWLRVARARLARLLSFDALPKARKGRATSWIDGLQAAEAMASALSAELEPSQALDAAARAHVDALAVMLGKPALPARMEGELGADAEPFMDAVRELEEVLADLPRMDRELHRAARGLLARLLERVEAGMRRRSTLSQSELLRAACRLVEQDARVRAAECARIRQMLLDEVQDTDPLQYALVRQLCLVGGGARRPGLFLVGDPKQSIYGWRNADLAELERFEHELVERHGAQVHDLVLNFRSTRAILDTVNLAVEPVMREEPGLQPRFAALVPHRERQGDKPRAFVPWLVDPADPATLDDNSTKGEAARLLEAPALAREVRRRIDAGAKPASIGVLCAYTSGLARHLEALREVGVPFEFASDRSYYRRREVLDAVAWLTCVVDPADALAFVAALKTAAGAVSDRRLLELSQAGLHGLAARHARWSREAGDELRRLCRATPSAAPLAGDEALVHAIESLWRLRELLAQGDAEGFLAALRELLGVEALEAARHLGEWRAANLARFFEIVRAHLHQKGGDALALLALLRDCVERGRREGDAPAGESVEAVRVMTVHSSKGLDFEHVFLVDTARKPNQREEPTTCEPRLGQSRLFGSPSPLWHRVRAARKRREEAERVRLWYVALTRAKDHLWVSSPLPARARASGAAHFRDLMARTLPVDADLAAPVRAHWADRASGAEPGAASEPPRLETEAWSIEYALEPGSELEAPPRRVAGAPPLARVRLDAERLRAAHELARERESRRLFHAASAAAPDEAPDARGPDEVEDPWSEGDFAAAASADHAARVASCAGKAVHLVLEDLPLGVDPRASLAALGDEQLERIVERALGGLPGAAALHPEVLASAATILRDFRASTLPERLAALWPKVVARELPVLAPLEAEGPLAPVHGLRGVVDLVWRDEDGGLVVVDWKTGRAGDLDQLVERHGRQLAAYARALRLALALPREPRRELWFVARGEVRAC
jgi:ATP-dependent helicase/nuclease subunit A